METESRLACPLSYANGIECIWCEKEKCMWWLGNECAIVTIAKALARLSKSRISEEVLIGADKA